MKHPILTPLSCLVLLAIMLACAVDPPDESDGGTGPDGRVVFGSQCVLTSECDAGFYCDFGLTECRAAGTGALGSACRQASDCTAGLVCDLAKPASVCENAGSGSKGQACTGIADCLAGLACIQNVCRTNGSDVDPSSVDAGVFDAAIDPGTGECVPSCEDGRLCTVNTCIGGTCVDFFLDFDEDGFGAAFLGCGDCSDDDPNARPGQTQFFTTPHPGQAFFNGPNFDYNCDGQIQLLFPGELPQCTSGRDESCPSSTVEGWVGGVPFCGQSGQWARCRVTGGSCTVEVIESGRVQACR